jgi:ATP-dependent helicase/nuclease subunit B
MILTQASLSDPRHAAGAFQMSQLAGDRFDQGPVDCQFWPALATRVQAWLRQQAVLSRDAVVLLPYAGLLPVARAAFARLGGWQPRIETTRTLAASLALPAPVAVGQISFDLATDRLSAAALLRGLAWGAAWARHDARGFAAAVSDTVLAAQALLRAAHAREPEARADYWSQWREALPGVLGPGTSERMLARVALEWAASADAPAADVLWRLRPAAWIGVRAGGRDALAQALFERARASGTPVLWLDADPPAAAPFDAAACLPAPQRLCCAGLEDEAQAAALAVLQACDQGHQPVALIAQDRVLVRRIRALLERAQVGVQDETGWTLSTTRAAARVMSLLRAASADAGRDQSLNWLKMDCPDESALQALEAQWRRGRAVATQAQALWQTAQASLQPLRSGAQRSLARWLTDLRSAAPAALRALADDAAGRQVLAALHLDGVAPSPAWQAAAAATPMLLADFTAWVDATLEAASFVPPAEAAASVVITPLANAVLRPFAAAVLAGCDEKRLGAASLPAPLLPDALAGRFGLVHAAERRERERMAFAQILRLPRLTLLRRSSENGEPLAASPLLDHAWQVRRRLAQPAPAEAPPALPCVSVVCAPPPRPAPAAAQALPQRLSASAVEALRACPYRFFALHVLGLRESPEFDTELEKRDYGTWLHAVLLRFHSQRPVYDAAPTDRLRLLAAADAEQAALALDAAQLLPFRAAFDGFASHYLAWLHERDAQGWRYEAGEQVLRSEPAALGGMALEGRIDRIDAQGADGTRQLIDYKTGSAPALKAKLREPLEDTQLAFYAAVLGPATPLRAMYLVLDERNKPQELEHLEVAASAEALIEGLAQDLTQLRAGAGMAALGQGTVCEHCDARGLCRRDHWHGGPQR